MTTVLHVLREFHSSLLEVLKTPHLPHDQALELVTTFSEWFGRELNLRRLRVADETEALLNEQERQRQPCDCTGANEAAQIAFGKCLANVQEIVELGEGLAPAAVVEVIDDHIGAPVVAELRAVTLRHKEALAARFGRKSGEQDDVFNFRILGELRQLRQRLVDLHEREDEAAADRFAAQEDEREDLADAIKDLLAEHGHDVNHVGLLFRGGELHSIDVDTMPADEGNELLDLVRRRVVRRNPTASSPEASDKEAA